MAQFGLAGRDSRAHLVLSCGMAVYKYYKTAYCKYKTRDCHEMWRRLSPGNRSGKLGMHRMSRLFFCRSWSGLAGMMRFAVPSKPSGSHLPIAPTQSPEVQPGPGGHLGIGPPHLTWSGSRVAAFRTTSAHVYM